MKVQRTVFVAAVCALLVGPLSVWSQSNTTPCVVVISAATRHRSSRPRGTFARMRHGIASEAGKIMGQSGTALVEVGPEVKVCPLSEREKLKLFLRDLYSPVTFVAAGLDGGLSQATAGRAGYGQGWDAYGRRYGASLADSQISGFFQTFLLPSLFHEDPRYFRAIRGSIPHRFQWAISRVVVARTDSGGRQFNHSEIFGNLLSSTVANAYYPDSSRTFARTVGGAFLNMASDAGWNLLKEFGPDIWRKLRPEKRP